jgi:hypothetical protein
MLYDAKEYWKVFPSCRTNERAVRGSPRKQGQVTEMSIRTDPITLQLFISAIEEQSIAKAAEKNNIAVSAVSRRISDLELLMKVLYFFDVGESSLNVAQSSDEPGETSIAAAPGGLAAHLSVHLTIHLGVTS